ncbi:MAG: 30S ribosomal protein S6 [Deltaproteobacteria bacterium]|jgi:small subunit ribosomal protein S6|nr:30S ribosomal protein S6 [Deltaproteobacteria bacterium]
MHPRRYETLILLSPQITQEQSEAFINKVNRILEKGNAKLVRFEDWGRKPLAYPVRKSLYGNYMLFDYQAFPEVAFEIKRNLKIDELVYKHLTLVLDRQFTEERFQTALLKKEAKSLSRYPLVKTKFSPTRGDGEYPAARREDGEYSASREDGEYPASREDGEYPSSAFSSPEGRLAEKDQKRLAEDDVSLKDDYADDLEDDSGDDDSDDDSDDNED